MKTWKFRSSFHASARSLADALRLPLPLARILVSRGIDTYEEASAFLYASLGELSGPYRLLNMGVAVEEIELAIKHAKKIVIYGDYDVDGICAVTLLHEAFSWLDVEVATYIPSRFKEGYGLNCDALARLQEEGYDFVITVDNGIAAKDLVDEFTKKGMTFIVTDHHTLPEDLPSCIIVNPLLHKDESEPFYKLCGTGVAYMLAMAMLIRLKPDLYDEWHRRKPLDLVALATVADMVPLLHDNRILVREGLALLNESPRPGIKALIELLCGDNTVVASDIAYRLAPCVNACGRLDRTAMALALFRYDADKTEIADLAEAVRDANTERKDIERDMTRTAINQFEDYTGKMVAAVAYGEDWHPGVIGVTAARLVEHFHVPSVVFTAVGGQEDLLSGSARSIKGVDLYESLASIKEHIVRFGGHKMAAGLTIKKTELEAFSRAFNEVCSHYEAAIDEDELWIDDVLRLEEATEDLEKAVRLMEPCGFENTEPLFAIEHQGRFEHTVIGKDGDHLRLSFPQKDGSSLQAIAFRKGDYDFKDKRRYDFAFHLGENCFRGLCRLQLNITDIAPSWQAEESVAMRSVMVSGENYVDAALSGLCDRTSFHTKIRGVSYANRQDLITTLKVGDAITLLRETNNPADKNAVACLTEGGATVGYLSREIASQLAPVMDLGARYSAQVQEVTGGGEGEHHGVNIIVYNLQEKNSCEVQNIHQKDLAGLDTASLMGILTESLIGDGELNEIQEAALHSVLEKGENTAVIMPTGRGKSLIYQLSAAVLATQKGKMTVVISPLKALINDQYLSLSDHLAPLGYRIYKGNGDVEPKERVALMQSLEQGEVDILLATPEFFVRHRALFAQMKERLGLIVIDEAHHMLDKRVSYQALRKLAPSFNHSIWLYLTATVPQAQDSAFAQIISGAALYIDAHIRYNLHIVDGRRSEQKLVYLYRLFMHPEKTICYVNSRKQAFGLARRLREILPYELRSLVGYYHGGLPQVSRRTIEEAFKEGEIRLLFATTAFGEGIHIPDIRNVVLYHPCFSLEAFNQLAGRCGRDGEEGKVHLLYAEKDFALNEMIISGRAPSREKLGRMYQALMHDAREHGFVLSGSEDKVFEMLQGMMEGVGKKEWRLALSIFEELDFLKTVKTDETYEIIVEQAPARRDLGESPSYLEGMSEQRALSQFQAVAFTKEIGVLESIVRSALVPENWHGREVMV